MSQRRVSVAMPSAWLLSLGLLVVAVDQLMKWWVEVSLAHRGPIRLLGGAVYLVYVRNSGAAFNLASRFTVVLTLCAIAVVLAIGAAAFRSLPRWQAVGFGLVLGGAAGNLSDRLFRDPAPFRGHVVDFISLFNSTGSIWPVFNVADSSLLCGVAVLVLFELKKARHISTGSAAASDTDTSSGSDPVH